VKHQKAIKIFEEKKVRTFWEEANEKWYLSIVDVIALLTDQNDFQELEIIGKY